MLRDCSSFRPATERTTIWIRLPRNRRPADWDNISGPVVRLESNSHGHPVSRFLLETKVGGKIAAREIGGRIKVGNVFALQVLCFGLEAVSVGGSEALDFRTQIEGLTG